MTELYYFDNSATTLKKPLAVAEAVYRAIADGQLGNPARGSHTASLNALRLTESLRRKTAALFSVPDASNVAFTANATASLNLVLKGLLKPTDHIITTVTEHNAVLRPLYQLEEQGAALSFVGVDEFGTLLYPDFERLLRPDTRAVVVNHASNVTGNAADLERIGSYCRDHDLLFIVDASQSAGVLAIDMIGQHIDVLCFTGHKSLYGPQGTGGICLGDRPLVFVPVFTGGSGFHSFDKKYPAQMPTLFEAGTQNVHGLAGLSAGLDYIGQKGLAAIGRQLQELTLRFREQIKDIPGITIYGHFDESAARAPVVSVNLEGWDSGDLSDALFMDYGIAVRPGAHCAPLIHQAFGTEKIGMVRFSFSSFNTLEEIDYAAKALRSLAEEG
ncbi:aminotransferase class V-fold PLP-dependent enzyme [Trichococcus ilyis]|uniref:Aminotransferase class-v n=1 Tax=Trichococcus ilyis TaxID=640938 RepID=A0A143Z8E2_9LACT|nr:aminotransferase class V-fold PLP-dependent enzyme [Trichococcus ilyis]CZR08759.1 aminotransferase class-v [Trichococcus ilyis]SEJ80522.1 cysteine desulfurase family protein [Trichococcus ilyis]